MDAVFRNGRVSRANIARELGLTRSTASSLVAGLTDEGLLIEDISPEDKGAGTGRPGTFVRLNPKHALFIGADIGVGRISVVAIDFTGTVVKKHHFEVDDRDCSPEAVLTMLATFVKSVAGPLVAHYTVRGLCVTVPGVLDKSGTVLRAPFLGWRKVPILDQLTALLPDMPVIVAENDANAFAIAHGYRTGQIASDTDVFMFLDAGVGGAAVMFGQLMRGHDGYAGEFGHIILGDRGFVQLATPAGSLESFIGLDAILARNVHHGGGSSDIQTFIEQVKAVEPPAVATMNDWSFYMGRALALLSSIFNPSRIVLGGPVAALFDLCKADVLASIRKNLLEDHPVPTVMLSDLGLEGPALGGAFMLHREMFSVDEGLIFRKQEDDSQGTRIPRHNLSLIS
nr:ROK family transcriptional regulator [Ensifer adhaerens]